MDLLGSYDVIVVGAGHAGIEAAVAIVADEQAGKQVRPCGG